MKRWQRWTVLAALGFATVVALNPAGAFVLSPGSPSDNVSAAAERAPGIMVGRGIAVHNAALDEFFGQGPPEVAPFLEDPIQDTFLPEAITIIFEQINAALDLLINALFVRAGETPPALTQVTGTETTPPSKVKEDSRRSLIDRTLDRVDR